MQSARHRQKLGKWIGTVPERHPATARLSQVWEKCGYTSIQPGQYPSDPTAYVH